MSDSVPMDSSAFDPARQDDGLVELLHAANRGDSVAYARFLHEVASALRNIIAAHGGTLQPAQHEEILQETLLTLHRKRDTLCEYARLRPWLCALACYRMTAAFRLRDRPVALRPEDFSELLLTPADRAAARAAFGHMTGADAKRLIVASFAALRTGLRRWRGAALTQRPGRSDTSPPPKR